MNTARVTDLHYVAFAIPDISSYHLTPNGNVPHQTMDADKGLWRVPA